MDARLKGKQLIREAGAPSGGFLEAIRSTGPILRREFLGLLRTKKAYWITALTVAGTGLIPLLGWPEGSTPMSFLSARHAFNVYCFVFGGALFLFVPVVSATAITTELEQNTYELLFSSRISPGGIVLGKFLASSLFFLLLLAFTFPMLCILYLLGGFKATSFLLLLLVLIAYTLLLALVGLWSSARNRRTTRALMQAYGFGIIAVIASGSCFILAVPFVTGLLLSLNRRARHPEFEFSIPPPKKRYLLTLSGWKPVPTARTWLVRKLLAPAEAGIPDGWNPVFAASVRGDGLLGLRPQRILFWGMAGILFYLPLFALLADSHPPRIFLMPGLLVLVSCAALILPGMSATSLLAERSLGRLELLRTAPLTAGEILRGKFLGMLSGVLCLLLLGIIYTGIFLLIFVFFGEIGGGLLCLLLFLALFLCTASVAISAGLLSATVAEGPLSALVLAYLLFTGAFIALPLLTGVTGLSPIFLMAGAVSETFISEDLLISVPFSFLLTALQLGIALPVFERRWLRG